MQNIHLHGDITLYPVKLKPAKNSEKEKIHILQNSGVTGNRHEVVSKKNPISRWKDKKEREFISCSKPFILQHVGGDAEHGVQNIEAGVYEVKRELEHDPWKDELRVVID